MKKALGAISKILLVVVIVGFFMPVACEASGPDLVVQSFEESDMMATVSGVLLIIAVGAAALGVITVFALGRGMINVMLPLVTLVAVVAAYFCMKEYMGGFLTTDMVDTGGWMMAGGAAGSLLFGIASAMVREY